MVLHPPPFVQVGLTLALVAMFALVVYWLVIKRRWTRRRSTSAPPPAAAAAHSRHRLDAAWFGAGAAIKEHAWNEALRLACNASQPWIGAGRLATTSIVRTRWTRCGTNDLLGW